MSKGDQTLMGAKAQLKNIIKDARTHPKLKMLAILLLMRENGDKLADELVKEQFGRPELMRKKQIDEEPLPEDPIQKEARERINKIWANGEEPNANTSGKC
jgi:hypothetical protein